MDRKCIAVLACISILILSAVLPAYAEVTSLKTNAGFYTPSTKMYFTGTVAKDDIGKVVYLAIHDSTGKFLSPLQGTMSNPDGTFAFTVTPDQQYTVKGIYNATAFVAQESAGQKTTFVFSPDGSPLKSSPPLNLQATTRSSTEIDLSWSAPQNNGGAPISGYTIERNDGNGFVAILTVQGTAYQDTGLTPSKNYSYRISATNSAGPSDPSNVATGTTFSVQPPSTTQPPASSGSSSTPSLEDLIQQRIEQAKKLQEQLHSQTGQQQNIQLNEKVGLGDSIAQNTPTPNNQNNGSLPQFNFGNILYPAIAVIGAGIVGAILYLRKIGVFPQQITTKQKFKEPEIAEQEDYAMMIPKNRLAKGELTLDQFHSIKEVLLEP